MSTTPSEIDPNPEDVGSRVSRRPLLDRYLIAAVATLLVAILRWHLDPVLGNVAAFAIFYVAIIFTAWYCGFGPAMAALVMGWCLASYLFDSSRGSFAVYPFRNQVACTVYVAVGVYLAYLIDWLTRNIARQAAGRTRFAGQPRAVAIASDRTGPYVAAERNGRNGREPGPRVESAAACRQELCPRQHSTLAERP